MNENNTPEARASSAKIELATLENMRKQNELLGLEIELQKVVVEREKVSLELDRLELEREKKK